MRATDFTGFLIPLTLARAFLVGVSATASVSG